MSKLKKLAKDNRGFIIFIILMATFRSAVADYSDVPTGSMIPTIVPGDRITIDKLAYDLKIPFINKTLMALNDPKRGDIVVFISEAADLRMVKRVIGTPGDVVQLINNQLIINGTALTYSAQESTYYTEQLENTSHAIQIKGYSELASFAAVQVPEGSLLVMGDNRNNSADSRVYGFVPREEVIGRANHVLVSLNPDENYKPRNGRFLKPLI